MDLNSREFLEHLGHPGRFAILLFFLVVLNYVPVSFNHLAMAVYGAVRKHHCKIPEGIPVDNYSIPLDKDGKLDSCQIYVNYTYMSGEKEPCLEGWEYTLLAGPPKEYTLVNQWDLVCERGYLKDVSTSIYFAGVLIGGLVFGTISDKLGRKPTILVTLYTPVLLGFILYFVESFVVFNIIRFVIGFLMQGLQMASYVYLAELFRTSEYRSYISALWEVTWSIGVMILAAVAYLLRDWRYMQMFIALTSLLSVAYMWWVPESLRWLISNKKYDKAHEYMLKAAKFNNVQLPEEVHQLKKMSEIAEYEHNDNKTTYNFFSIFCTPKLFARSLILAYVWNRVLEIEMCAQLFVFFRFATSLGYYGLSLQASSSRFGNNRYLNFFISGAIEFPAYLSGLFILRVIGRRLPLAFYFIVGGIVCIVSIFITGNNYSGTTASITLAWIGKFCTAGCWSVVFLYASEIYPTVIRNVGVGFCAAFARVGSLVAPQILSVRYYSQPWVPMVVFGCVSIVGGLITLLLPETLYEEMPETIQDAEAIPWPWRQEVLWPCQRRKPAEKATKVNAYDNPASIDTRF